LELRSDSTAGSILAQQAVLLLSDGSVIDTSGTDLPGFTGITEDSVFVVVRHRNHLPAMSPDKVEIVTSVASHDFTASVKAAYSSNGPPLVDLGDGPFGLFAGDANADGFMDALDLEAYITQTTSAASGFQLADFNMDTSVDALDINLWIANSAVGASSHVP
jgi:hypothetical protein